MIVLVVMVLTTLTLPLVTVVSLGQSHSMRCIVKSLCWLEAEHDRERLESASKLPLVSMETLRAE